MLFYEGCVIQIYEFTKLFSTHLLLAPSPDGVPDDEVLLHPGDNVYTFKRSEIQIILAYKHVHCLWVF